MEIRVDIRQLAEERGGDGKDEWLPLMEEGASRALGSMMQLGSIDGNRSRFGGGFSPTTTGKWDTCTRSARYASRKIREAGESHEHV